MPKRHSSWTRALSGAVPGDSEWRNVFRIHSVPLPNRNPKKLRVRDAASLAGLDHFLQRIGVEFAGLRAPPCGVSGIGWADPIGAWEVSRDNNLLCHSTPELQTGRGTSHSPLPCQGSQHPNSVGAADSRSTVSQMPIAGGKAKDIPCVQGLANMVPIRSARFAGNPARGRFWDTLQPDPRPASVGAPGRGEVWLVSYLNHRRVGSCRPSLRDGVRLWSRERSRRRGWADPVGTR